MAKREAKRQERKLRRMIRYNVYLTEWQLAELHRIHADVGIMVAEQVRRAIDAWLEARRAPAFPRRSRH